MSLERCAIGLIEDDPILGESLVQRLAIEGADVTWWKTKAEAVQGLSKRRPQAVICDLKLPDGNGEEIFLETVKSERAPPFLFMTAFGEIDQAVRLMRCGAADYVTKPFEMSVFLERLETLVDPAEPEGEGLLGVSPAMRALESTLMRLARVSAPVLLTGETGCGKEVCARLLHASRGTAGPFMAVNCAAIPSDLMESELFGHEKGSFSGAHARHLGYAERAGAGTLFLDEIGDLAPKLQAKLLRLLEDRNFSRVGGEQIVPFRARVVCATNADLHRKVREGTFREDLLYRINVVHVPVPPLRDRNEDVIWLINRFVAEFASEMGERVQGASALTLEAALAHSWPGNVRELRNRVERAVALSDGPLLMPGDLFPDLETAFKPSQREGLEGIRDEAERRHIARVLSENDGAVLATAKALGVSRTTLWEKMRRYGLGSARD